MLHIQVVQDSRMSIFCAPTTNCKHLVEREVNMPARQECQWVCTCVSSPQMCHKTWISVLSVVNCSSYPWFTYELHLSICSHYIHSHVQVNMQQWYRVYTEKNLKNTTVVLWSTHSFYNHYVCFTIVGFTNYNKSTMLRHLLLLYTC